MERESQAEPLLEPVEEPNVRITLPIDPPEPEEHKGKLAEALEKGQVSIVFTLFVILRAMDRVFNKRVNDRMVNYQIAYVNFFWPVGAQLMTAALCGAWVCVHRYVYGDRAYGLNFFSPRSQIASAHGAYPQWRLSLFSFWDQLNAILTSLPSPFIDMTSQSILSNFVVIWTVVLSFFYLGTRYADCHVIGCALILLSCVVAVVVQLQTGHPPLGEYALPDGKLAVASPLWYILFLVGTVPAGVSNVYKQSCLKDVDLEVMYASLWAGNWQIMWGLLLFPFNWIPLPPPAQVSAPDELGSYLHRTGLCFVGIAPSNSTGDLACASPGGSAAVWFMVYLVFNASFNVLLLWLTKRMSATWATIATVLCLDLTSLFSMSRALMGDEAQKVTLEQYLGLILAALAMWTYNLQPERDKEGNLVEGAHAFEARPPTVSVSAADRASLIGRHSSLVRRSSAASHESARRSTPPVMAMGE